MAATFIKKQQVKTALSTKQLRVTSTIKKRSYENIDRRIGHPLQIYIPNRQKRK